MGCHFQWDNHGSVSKEIFKQYKQYAEPAGELIIFHYLPFTCTNRFSLSMDLRIAIIDEKDFSRKLILLG